MCIEMLLMTSPLPSLVVVVLFVKIGYNKRDAVALKSNYHHGEGIEQYVSAVQGKKRVKLTDKLDDCEVIMVLWSGVCWCCPG